MANDRNLELSLFLIRISTAIFLLVWAVAKFANIKQQQGVFGTFYGWKEITPETLAMIGAVQILLILAFAAGAFKTWTYAAIFLMHGAGTFAGWSRMIPPYGPGASMTFWAAVPVLAGILALFLLRDRDRLLAWGR